MDPAAPQVSYMVSAQSVFGEIVREDSPIRSPKRITQTSNHTVDLTAPLVNYTVSAQTGLATIVDELSLTNSRNSRAERSTDQNQLFFKRISGPDKVLSNNVSDILSQWHDSHPGTKPPCAFAGNSRLPPSYKIFDRDGGEYEISEMKVSVKPRHVDRQSARKPTLHYKVMIVHSENGPDELVTVINRRKTDREKMIALFVDSSKVADTFLVAWLGPKEEFEPEPCAVVVKSVDGGKVKFRPEWFDSTPRASSPRKRPVRSSQIEPPQNAVFSPELVGTPASPGRSATSSPSKAPNHRDNDPSLRRADSDDLIESESGFRDVPMPLVDNGDNNHAVTSHSGNQNFDSRKLVCRNISYAIKSPKGTNHTLPQEIREILRQWHDTYPLDPPPCAVDWRLRHAQNQLGFSNGTYDRDGSQCVVFWFELVEEAVRLGRRHYRHHILVLRMANSSDVLVCARHRFHPDKERTSLVFLEPWLGLDGSSENQAIAVSIYDKEGPPTGFSADLFNIVSDNFRQGKSGFPVQGQDPTTLQLHDEDGGSYRASSMLPPDSTVSFGGTLYGGAPSESCNIKGEISRQNTATPSAISRSQEDPEVFGGSALPHVDHGHQIHTTRRLFGREQPLQSYIRTQLEEWHSDHGDKLLPYHLRLPEHDLSALTPCNVFDRAGVMREFSVFSVFVSRTVDCVDQYLQQILSDNSVSYSVVVLHTETDGDKLVALAPPTALKNGVQAQYLLAWNGTTKQFETEVCAIAVHRNVQHGEGPGFSLGRFDESISWTSSWVAAMNEALSPTDMTHADDLMVTDHEPEKLAAVSQSPKAKLEAPEPSPTLSDSLSPPRSKRRKSTSESDTSFVLADDVYKLPVMNHGLRAKFVSETSDSVRIFSLAGCDVETLFRKAKEFY